MVKVRIVVEADIRPTEDKDKVITIVEKIIKPDTIKIEGEEGSTQRLIAIAYSLKNLEKLRYALRTQRILDAARKAMRKGTTSNKLIFYLHKQALAAGKLSFIGGDNESPLGAITVLVEHPEPKRVIDWFAPPTVRGRPVFELDQPPE